jgi:hypothetical protein
MAREGENRMTYSSHAIRGWALGAWAAVLLAGCGADSDRFFIVQNQVPEDGCVIPGDHTTLYRGTGTLDVGLVSAGAGGYRFFPLLQSDLPALGQAGGTEPNRMALRKFHVVLDLGAEPPPEVVELFGTPALWPYLDYEEPWSGTLEPGGGTISAGVTVVPAEVARQIDATGVFDRISSVLLEARVSAIGDTLSDTIESRQFRYPIYACKYCLISRLGTCPYAPANAGNVCNVAQDDAVDCCTDGQSLICPASAPATGAASQ